MAPIQAVIISIIEGITEFLPISSTGHMILASDLMRIGQTDFVKSFEIFIQLGAIFAVLVLYWKKVFAGIQYWGRILAAFVPTAVIGFGLYKVVKSYLIGNTVVVLVSLFLGGTALIVLERYYSKRERKLKDIRDLSYPKAMIIGLVQSLSIIPGVSRAAATIFGGMFVGLGRKDAVEFSFVLAIPTMFAATGLDLLKSSHNFTTQQFVILTIGFFGAFITAIISIKFLLSFVKNHTFVPFGVYRIILAAVMWVVLMR